MEKPSKKLIVIVDDDQDLLDILKFSFETKGFQVKTMINGHDALQYLSEEKNREEIALLILDRMLPDMDGIEILDKVNRDESNTLPVLILSALSSDKDMLSGLKRGALDYIVKPFNQEILIEKAIHLMK